MNRPASQASARIRHPHLPPPSALWADPIAKPVVNAGAGKNKKVVYAPDPLIVGASSHVIGRDDSILGKTLRPGNGKQK